MDLKVLRTAEEETMLSISRGLGERSASPVANVEASDPRSGRRPVRVLCLAVLVVLLGGTGALTWVTRGFVDDQERRLLQQRASEAALVLTVATTSVQAGVASLGETARVTNNSPTAFADAAARLLVSTPTLKTLALVRPSPGGFLVE